MNLQSGLEIIKICCSPLCLLCWLVGAKKVRPSFDNLPPSRSRDRVSRDRVILLCNTIFELKPGLLIKKDMDTVHLYCGRFCGIVIDLNLPRL